MAQPDGVEKEGHVKRICVVGTGYVGLVTGACFASLGNRVTCLDVIPEKIARLRAGEMPIYEPGLEPLVAHNVEAGRLYFTTSYAEAVADADYIFIAVGTPTLANSDAADMQYVEAAARSIAAHLTGPAIIVNKSTMPVGSGDLVSAIVHEHLRDDTLSVGVVSNPEFLREGSAVQDFLRPDRVVLGSTDRAAAQQVAELYLPLRAPIVITDLYTAEMIKYASNAFLATKISFINEIARICERLGADVKEVAAGMGYDKRIGRPFLDAGLGYGGSCFGKDVKALMHMAAEADLHPQMLEAVTTINRDQRRLSIQKLEEELGGAEGLEGKTFALLGLAFKANTDDMRDAASIDIIRWLLEAGAVARVFDPVAMKTARVALAEELAALPQPLRERVIFCDDEYEAATETDGVIVVTEWSRFRELNLARLRDAMKPRATGRVFVDGRNLFEPAEMARLGFRYLGIGRGTERKNGRNGAGHPGHDSAHATGSHAANGASVKTVPAEGMTKSRATGRNGRSK
jgi:UDPglucose 6-dehydrogenase